MFRLTAPQVALVGFCVYYRDAAISHLRHIGGAKGKLSLGYSLGVKLRGLPVRCVIGRAAGDQVVRVSFHRDRDASSFSIMVLVRRVIADDVSLTQILRDTIVNLGGL